MKRKICQKIRSRFQLKFYKYIKSYFLYFNMLKVAPYIEKAARAERRDSIKENWYFLQADFHVSEEYGTAIEYSLIPFCYFLHIFVCQILEIFIQLCILFFVFEMYNCYLHDTGRKNKTNASPFPIKILLRGVKGFLFILHTEIFFASFYEAHLPNEV